MKILVQLPYNLRGYGCSYESKMNFQVISHSYSTNSFSGAAVLTTYRLILFQQLGDSLYTLYLSIPYCSIFKLQTALRRDIDEKSITINLISPLKFAISFQEEIQNVEVFVTKLLAFSAIPKAFYLDGHQNEMRSSAGNGFLYYNNLRLYLRNRLPIFKFQEDKLQTVGQLQILAQHKQQLAPVNYFNIFYCFHHVAVQLYEADERPIIQCSSLIISDANMYYSICETYPAFLVIPEVATIDLLKKVAQYRLQGRIPVVTYYSPKFPLLLRSSQPLRQYGTNSKGQKEDVQYLYLFMTEQFPKLTIFDARPFANAVGNQLLGKGYENSKEYPFVSQLIFLNLENIHVYRDSFIKMRLSFVNFFNTQKQILLLTGNQEELQDDAVISQHQEVFDLSNYLNTNVSDDYDVNLETISELSNQSNISLSNRSNRSKDVSQYSQRTETHQGSQLLKDVCDSKWLFHKSALLQATKRIINTLIIEKNNALVHCSDGWDRTSILCALVQIYLDGYFRTVEGFCMLITKDFHSFGHKFGIRQGLIQYEQNVVSQWSPIFLMFLECVAQILQNNTDQFEFDDDFLLYLAFHSYNNRYSDFLFNCEAEMISQQVFERSSSVFENCLEYKVHDIDQTQSIIINDKTNVWDQYWNVYSNAFHK